MAEKMRPQVGIGTHVTVELMDEQGGREEFTFDVATDVAADVTRNLLSVEAPLVRAIRGKFEGAEVDYRMGDICRVRIVAVEPAQNPAAPDAAARRQAVLEEARRKAERTNADMFASSFSGKWGDYNTDGMTDDMADDLTNGLTDET